jgi:hypothetical protein
MGFAAIIRNGSKKDSAIRLLIRIITKQMWQTEQIITNLTNRDIYEISSG